MTEPISLPDELVEWSTKRLIAGVAVGDEPLQSMAIAILQAAADDPEFLRLLIERHGVEVTGAALNRAEYAFPSLESSNGEVEE